MPFLTNPPAQNLGQKFACAKSITFRRPCVSLPKIAYSKTWHREYCIFIMTRGGKYSLSTREITREEPAGFPEGSGYISHYIPTWVIIQIFSISKSYTSSIVLPGKAILEELILRIGLAAGAIFSRIAKLMK